MSIQNYWRQNRQTNQQAMLSSFGSINKVWYLFPQGTGPANNAPSMNCFTSFAALAPNLRSRDLILISGVLREQAVAPLGIYDISIVGAADSPRQATSGGVPTGGGATWMLPTTPVATTPLLEVRAAGWSFFNIEFTPANASAAVRLTRSATVDTTDASHATFNNCFFGGNGGTTQNGIEDNGGCSRVIIEDCRFEGLGNTAILSLNTAAAIPLGWRISRNRFQQNLNDVKMSLSYSIIEWNYFMTAGSGATNKVVSTTFISGQGNNNHVSHNGFTNIGTGIANASGYNAGAADAWEDNYALDGVDYGIPA